MMSRVLRIHYTSGYIYLLHSKIYCLHTLRDLHIRGTQSGPFGAIVQRGNFGFLSLVNYSLDF